MSETITVKPADAALVREIAHDRAFEGASWHRIDSEAEAVLSAEAARLHALADVLEKAEKEQAERTARCWECGQPVNPL